MTPYAPNLSERSPDETSAASFIDIVCETGYSRGLLLLALGLLATIILIGFKNSTDGSNLLTFSMAVLLASFVGSLLFLLIRQSQHHGRLRQLAGIGDLEGCARYLAKIDLLFGARNFVPGLIERLRKEGRSNVTIVVRRATFDGPIVPIIHVVQPFFPNETDPQFIQLETIDGSNVQNQCSSESTSNATDDDQAIVRRIKSFRCLRGGWRHFLSSNLITLLFLLFFVQIRRPSGIVLTFLLATIGLMMAGPFIAFWSQQNWLLVPGGVILRTASKTPGRSDLHVFNRRNSILIVIQINPLACVFYGMDQNRDFDGTATIRETRMLLRAWLSPLEPPPVEKLVDLQ